MSAEKMIAIVIPVYNDWQSFNVLVQQIDKVAQDLQRKITVTVVNDGSPNQQPALPNLSAFTHSIEVIHLIRNLGHQRAIAIGLVTLLKRDDIDSVVVMDADGEDKPEDIKSLLNTHQLSPEKIVVAKRRNRSEGIIFQLYYRLYQFLFRLMTGVNIDFGNFCLIPYTYLETLTFNPNIWNHLAATINRSSTEIIKQNLDRGKRIFSQSKMSYQGLILHGLSAISVYLDVVIVRALLLFSLIGILAVMGIILVVYIVFGTDLAIPGWATNAVGILIIIIFQNMFLLFGAVFAILNQRTRILITPALDTLHLIKRREVLIG